MTMGMTVRLRGIVNALITLSIAVAPVGGGEIADDNVPVVVTGASGESFVLSPDKLTPSVVTGLSDSADDPIQRRQVVEGAIAGATTFPPNSPPSTNWRGCGLFDAENQFVASYVRLRVSSKIPKGSVATLSCGNSKYGYRHVQANHADDWTSMGNRAGGVPWRDLAGWSMAWALRDPDKASTSGTRFCYSRKVFVYRKSDGRLMLSQDVRVALGETGRMLITAYPSSPCSGTNIVG